MANIDKLHICGCNISKVIPLAFDESMSFLEQLCAMLNKLNETITQVNFNTEVTENIQLNFDTIYEQIEDLNQKINSLKSEIYSAVDIKLINQKQEITNIINNEKQVINNRIDNEVDTLNNKIEEIELGQIDVFDPTTGSLENINVVIQNVYDALRTGGITCHEFDVLNLTALEFDSKELTAFNFDVNAKALLTA